jgi:hypothetical protein
MQEDGVKGDPGLKDIRDQDSGRVPGGLGQGG